MRYKGLDLNLLVTLKILLDERSVSAAAERLHLTQPAISAALKRLREFFNDDLLVANGKHLVPSAHALQILPELNTLIGNIDLFVTQATPFSPQHLKRRFRLAANDYFCSVFLAPLLPKLLTLAPGIDITVVPTDNTLVSRLNRAEVDIAFGPENTLAENLLKQYLFDEELVVLADKHHPVFKSGLTLKTMAESAQVLVDLTGMSGKSLVRRAFQTMGLSINEKVTVTSFLLAPEFILNTGLVTLIHRRLAKKFIRYLPLKMAELPEALREQTHLRYFGFYHSTREHDPGIQWLLQQISEQIAE